MAESQRAVVAYRFTVQQPARAVVCPVDAPRLTSPSHWFVGVPAQPFATQLSVMRCTGQPIGLIAVGLHGVRVAFTVQKRSVEYGIPLRQ
jgi:hypothetical protein